MMLLYRLDQFEVGDRVMLPGPPMMAATIKSKSGGSVSVDAVRRNKGKAVHFSTQWANGTLCRKVQNDYVLPGLEPPSQPASDKPATQAKPAASPNEPAPPKAAVGKDIFGVRLGSAAGNVNAYLLAKAGPVSLDEIVANVPGTKRDNVKSHLKRMVGDKLLQDLSPDGWGKGCSIVVSVPQKTGVKKDVERPRKDSGEAKKPSQSDKGKRGQRSGSGNRSEGRTKADGAAQRRTKRS